MESSNFEILRDQWPGLAGFGAFAEQYVHSDSASALLKLRNFTEHLVEWLYRFHSLPLPYQPNLFDLLAADAFKGIVPPVVLDKLHLIRVHGNKAAHGQKLRSRKEALRNSSPSSALVSMLPTPSSLTRRRLANALSTVCWLQRVGMSVLMGQELTM